MLRRKHIGICVLLGCMAISGISAKEAKPEIDVVFVLDTTGSMGGLIQAAKTKIWSIANTMASAKPTPNIRMGLVAYRDRGDAYITQVTDLSTDLDAIYAELLKFEAQGGGDGPESVNQALADAVSKISWSKNKKAYKVIFLVGDAPPHMDYNETKYPATCQAAVKKDIVINTIQCGNDGSATEPWREIARLSEGDYTQIGQSGNAVVIATPYDDRLSTLNGSLSRTYVYKSTAAGVRESAKMLKADAVMDSAPKPAAASRAMYAARKAKEAKDIVASVDAKPEMLDEMAVDELPAEMREMDAKQRKEYVKKKAEERAKVSNEIVELSKKRQTYIQMELKKANKGKNSLDATIFKSISKQAGKKGLKFEEGPSL